MNKNMTNHDRISSYIDNELSMEQEQDFLISLASSDSLRKSFRSELVLKNVIHRDDVLTEPSRDMRPAILGAIGIATVAATADTSSAAVATKAGSSIFKSMFATKIHALVTASLITASALAGYGVRTAISEGPAPAAAKTATVKMTPAGPLTEPQTLELQQPATLSEVPVSHESAPAKAAIAKSAVKKPSGSTQQTSTPINVSGSGAVSVQPRIK